tara:strand:+ start:1493 stop:2707 length:1215 start_codon:yes stop_codon:yes gene_type:complete
MKISKFIPWVFILSACALLAIGRVYDERLVLFDINLPIVISSIYFLCVIFILFSIKRITFSKSKFLFYLFYLLVLIVNPILWMIFGKTDFGLGNFINFSLIIVPISIIVLEKYERKDVLRTVYVLLLVSCFLALLSSIGLSLSDRPDGRLATLGGGPIVFARWMGFGIISLLLLPTAIRKRYRYGIALLFLILALSSGSRGPILSLFLTGMVYIFLNFNKVIIKTSLLVILIISIFSFSGLENKLSDFGKLDRVFMNISKKGGSFQSTSARARLITSSFVMLQNYPFGVGSGNWRVVSNQLRPNDLTPDELEYPHNLFLEVACEYGIATFIVIVFLFLYVFYLSYIRMVRYYRDKTSLYTLLFYLLIFFSLNSMVSGMLNDSRLLFLIISFILIQKPLIMVENE